MTTKTQPKPKTRDEQYARAAELARRDGIVVKAITISGTAGGERVFIAVRPKTLSTHVVRCEGGTLTCDSACASSKFGNYCSHRAATRAFLIAERDNTTSVFSPEPAPVVTHDRETAPMADRGGFSMWRAS